MEFINYIIYLGGWRPYLFSYECILDVLQSRKKYKKEMSCCGDPTAHQPPPVASVSVLKTLTASGESVECPDPIVAAAMLEATQLTDREREIILGVLGRDELLRRDQQLRVLQLKAELQNLRRKGALRPSTDLDTTGPDQDPDRYCRRCRVKLGRVINRGAYCRACRLKVCKACREYSLRTTDWVCTVCKKQMEIQAASGEWMNEFVKRPNKRRENRVCLPTADIIKRTIRRSWTISNPTPRWSAMRGSPELRPYNSLPRKQNINNYPSLALHQTKNQEVPLQEAPSPTYRRRSPRRTQSEDIYDDQSLSSQYRGISPITQTVNSTDVDSQRHSRMNPLSKLSDGRLDIERRRSPMRRSNEGSSEDGSSKEDGSPKSKGILTPETARKFERNYIEKRVSFESHVPYTKMSKPTPVLRTQSLIEGRVQNHLPSRYSVHQEDNSDNSEEATQADVQDSREENNSIELCEIEPFSGTVFRKMMVRRRRQNNARSISGSATNCSTTENANVAIYRNPVLALTLTVAGSTIIFLKSKLSNQLSSDRITGLVPGWRRGPDSDLWDILLPEGDDYKLVFINSDGSSKEETSSREEDDNDSTSTTSSFPIDECDWDYFEPGTRPTPVINWGSPFGSPRVYRRDMVESPIGSPLVYRRRMRESDTGTDEDNIRQDSGSPASSDSLFQSRTLSEEISFDTNQSRREKVLDDTAALQCVHSEEVFTKPSCHACGAQTQFIPIPVPVPIPFPVPTLWPPHEPPLMVFGEQRFRVLPRNLWPYLSQSALIWPTLNANGGNAGTTMPATTDRDGCALGTHKEPDNVPPVVEAEENITGYLECENRYASTSDSSSDCSDNSGSRVRRMYNVSGTERHSDDALPSSNVSSDNDEEDGRMSHSSVREDDMTSSGSADTDSDDTGTVADQKTRRFSRIFVVNKNLSSSSNSCSSSSDTDTSDNDTDTELDCTVILTNVKQLDEKDDVCDSKSSDKATENSTKQNKENYFSSPGLSDVSAESVNSSDVDQIKDFNDTSKDFISKENYGVNELTDNVDSYLSKANVEKNLCKNKQKLSDVINEKTFSFDDSDLIETELYTDEVAVIKLTKSDIEAIKKEYETDLPFGDEFKLNEAVHFKINKDEVDEPENNVRNENEEKESFQGSKKISSSSIKSNLTKGNTNKDFVNLKTSKKSTVTFNLSEESSNFENEKCEKITTELNPDDEVNVVSSEVNNTANINTKEETKKSLLCADKGDALIAHEKFESTSYDYTNKSETSSESLTEDQVQTTHPLQGQIKDSSDIKDNVITTNKAVLEDEKGKTNIYNKTACSTIKTNMTLDGQNIENLEFRSISFTNILDNDDDNGSNQSSITETTQISDNDYLNEIETLLESFDYQKTDDEITVSSILTSDTNVTDNVSAEKITNNEYLEIDIFGDHIITDQEIKEHFNACEELPHPIEKINDIDEYIDIEKPLLDISQACSINYKSNTSNTEDDIADLMFFDEEDVKINDSMTISDKVVVEEYNFQNMSDDDNNHVNKNGIKKDIETIAEGKNKFEELINSFDTDTLKDIENIDGYGYLKLDINDEDIKNITDNVEAVVINISDIDFTQSTYYFIESKKSVDRNLHDDSAVETCNKSSQISEENNNDHIGNGILSSKVVCDDRKKIKAEDSQDIVILDNLANLDSVESEVEEQNDLLGTSTSITRLVLKANEFDNDSNRILDTLLEESKMIDHKNVEKLDDTLDLDLIIPSKIEENYSAIKNQNEVFSHITTEILGADIKTNEEIEIKVDNFSEPSKKCNENFQTIDAGLNLIDTTRNVDSESGFTHDNDLLKNETILTGFVEPTTTDLLLSLQNKKIKEITDKSVTNSSKINTTPSAPMGGQETAVTDNIHENVKLFDEFGANKKIEYGLQTIAPVLANTTEVSHNYQEETVNESHDNYAFNSGSIDKNTRDPSAQLDVKFEIRAYDTKDIDLNREAEKSVTTNDSPNELDTVVSPCLKYELNVFDLDEIDIHEKCEKSPIISDTLDTMSTAVSPNRRFKLSAFNNEEIDIYEESDISPIISDSSDTISTTVSPCMKFELSGFDNEEIDMYEESDISPIISDSSEIMSTAVSSCMQFELDAFDKEEIDISKETAKSPIISDSSDTISTPVSPCMKFELSDFDNEEIDMYEESDISPIISDTSDAINTAVAPCIKFEIGAFDEEEINIYEDTAKSEESPITCGSPDDSSTVVSPCMKFEIKSFNYADVNVLEESDQSAITTDSCDEESTVVLPRMKYEIKSFDNEDGNVEESNKSAITTDSCDEVSTVVLPRMKFEIKPFENEDANVLEKSDKLAITTDSCDEVSTVVLPRMKFEIIPFDNEDGNVEKSDKLAITTDSCDEENTVVLPRMKFEIKPFDNEDGNVEESDKSEITTDSCDEVSTVVLPCMKFEIKSFDNEDGNVEECETSAITTDSSDELSTVILPCMKFEIKSFDNEDGNVEESDKSAITSESSDELNTVVLPCMKFEIKSFDNEDGNVEESDKSAITSESSDELNTVLLPRMKFEIKSFDNEDANILEESDKSAITCDEVSTVVLPRMKFEIKPFDNEDGNVEESDKSEITTDSYDEVSTVVLPCMKFEIKSFDNEDGNVEECETSAITTDSSDELNTVLLPRMKFEIKPFENEDANVLEESDKSAITTDSCEEVSTVVLPRMKFEIKSFDNEDGNVEECETSAITTDSSDELTTVVLPCMKFEIKSFDNEDGNVEESDKSVITSESCDEACTVVLPCMKFEIKPFDNEDANVLEESDKSAITCDEVSTVVLPRMKFEIKPFDNEDGNVEESDKSEITTDSCDEVSTVVLPCMKFEIKSYENEDADVLELCDKSAITTDSYNEGSTVVLPCMKFEIKAFDIEDANVLEESDKSAITTDSCDETCTVVLPCMKFEIKPFDNEDANVSEESDKSAITTVSCDEVCTVVLPCMKFEIKPFDNEDANVLEESDKLAVTADSCDEENTVVLPRMKFEIKPFENEDADVLEECDKSAITSNSSHEPRSVVSSFRKFEPIFTDSNDITKTTVSPCMKFERKPFENEEVNVFDEFKKSQITNGASYNISTVLSPYMKFEIKPFDTKEVNVYDESHKSPITSNLSDKPPITNYPSDKLSTVASPCMKFEIKPFGEKTIDIFEETDKELQTENIEDVYETFERVVSPCMKFELKAFNTETINVYDESDDSLEDIRESCETFRNVVSPTMRFELKSFNTETINIYEESNDSNQPVAKKGLDIVPNRKDLNYLKTSNRAVVYSSNSFGDDDIDISRSHEIIKSFDKAGKMTDCMLDIGNEIEDNVDFLKNFDNIKLAQNFKFTLRSYGEDESKKHLTNKRDATTPNIIEKIFKRKRISENDESETHEITSEEICEKRLNKDLLVSKISSENPLISNISCPTIPHTDNDQLMDTVDVGKTPVETAGADHQRALSEWNEIRSIDAVNVEGKSLPARNDGVQPGAIVCGEVLSRHAARYTSLVMITQDPAPNYQQVSVVTSDTTTLVPGNDVIVRHTNWQEDENKQQEKIRDNHKQEKESVTVITGGDTLSAFEEGLADDDSWVENLSHDDEDEDEFATNSGTEDSSSGEEVTLTCSAAIDQEEDLRGYHRTAIDFTLHTIVEESCEESEVEQNVSKKKERPASATDLEKYFFFGLGDGMGPSLQSNREDAFSETSSIYSEGMESLGSEEVQTPNDNSDPAELASSRLEKYFLSGFMGFTAERRDSDGSVGSDSEGRPSPEQRRKRLVRARGTGRSHSSSLDNLDNAISEQTIETQMSSEHSSSSDSENYDETNSFEKPDGQFDTVKRKKNKKHKNTTSTDESKNLEITQEIEEKCSESDEDGHKTPQPEVQSPISNLTTTKNQQSRDSGFVGSCDDLLREQRDNSTPDFTSGKNELIKTELEGITEEKKLEEKLISVSTPPATSLTRKDSFNNWSSDEETNLMMCKMRQFFKTMVANSQLNASSKPSTPNLSCTIKPVPSPRAKRCKPPQLVYFENELTRLMKTVPGIREDQVREIVEYLSSEDTWSDSYDSSDYTSSDLEITTTKTVLQQQISDSCKQIINKFDNIVDDEGDEGDGGIIDESHGLNKETAFVYQKLVASFEKMAAGENSDNNISKVTPHSSPPLIAKVMHHIGSRLVALMHEVSSGESHASNSPKTKHYHRRLQHKISSASSTTTEDDYPDGTGDISNYDEHVPYNLLPRSQSHDLLVGEARILHQSTSGVSDITEEKEASDCERFSWRGSFESALLATDSRNRLSLLGGEASASASALAIAAKRRSAGDLLFTNKSLSREQLDRVRSCGSIGGANSEDKLWVASAIRPNRRRSSVPDATCGSGGSADGEDEDEDIESRATLPRSLQGGTPTTNSLPRLPTTISSNSIQKSQSHHFLSQNVKSARYRPPGFNRLMSIPKRAVSAPGLQPSHQRRGRRSQQNNVPNDESGVSEAHSSPMLASPRNGTKSATTSPVTSISKRIGHDWHHEEDLDRIVSLHGRASLSTLGARSDSMASVYSGAGEGRYGSVAVRGQVEFGLQYNYKAGALEIQIKQCRDLAPVDIKRNRSDPYVKVYLLPDKSKSGKRKTKVKKHTLNPVFDECLKFHISLNGLETRTLWLTVWHSDMFGRNDFLGEVMMTLENKVFDDPTPKWYNLQERTEPFEDVSSYKGDIIVCLKFVPPDMTIQKKGKRSRGALHVLIKEAKSLTAVKANGTSDPFCKSYLLPDKGRSSKQKTPIARRTTNPVWNYTFVYDDVSLQELAERCLELTVWDHDRLASNEFLGGVRFSLGTGKHYGKPVDWMDASGREMSLWKNMLEKPNFWVEGSLSLRSSLESRGS
ncbi:uncharacterized protein LOC130898064 isoform X2 [Diorhabda carinulata]|uniref:uncharacterized protein LOC130898064 isoform X2 n=1 Tax=Diorhabda carinulata TaxID=1163345 RepID=UPI0025A014C8|nr:uncharacterized protein LOC130898064 isoform X2 [Diorhabda carinulata]